MYRGYQGCSCKWSMRGAEEWQRRPTRGHAASFVTCCVVGKRVEALSSRNVSGFFLCNTALMTVNCGASLRSALSGEDASKPVICRQCRMRLRWQNDLRRRIDDERNNEEQAGTITDG